MPTVTDRAPSIATDRDVVAPARETIAAELREARERTLALIAPLSESDVRIQHDPLMSPIVWNLGHIARFEELWLARSVDAPASPDEIAELSNPFDHPRRARGPLALPSLAEALRHMTEVRERVLERLEQVSFDDNDPLRRSAYVYRMVLQHEYQHNETILQGLQLKTGRPYVAPRSIRLPVRGDASLAGGEVLVRAGRYPVGTLDRLRAWDNERPQHMVSLDDFWIDIAPVTNGEYTAFIEDGGYGRPELWTDAGWDWRVESGADAPKYWLPDGQKWITRSMDREARPDPLAPVCHVCWYEADAFARWAGKRLPTEYEWEVAASWDPRSGERREHPWGEVMATPELANVDQLSFGTAPIGAYPSNASPLGCHDMIGNVWEWTASDFHGYPGFAAFPHAQHSEAFFGADYKVLRGGSWATRPGAIRNSFRNWDYPIRRQIFAGFRCVRDDDE